MTRTDLQAIARWVTTSAFLCITVTSVGCPRPDARTHTMLRDEQAVARVQNASAKRNSFAGTIRARLPGMQGFVANVTLDVAVQHPASASVAVRSFFEQPLQVIATDGIQVTMFDATSGAPRFFSGPANAQAFSRVLPLPLFPDEMVALFLARPLEDARGRLRGVDEQQGTYTLWWERESRGPVETIVRMSDDAILSWRAFRPDGIAVLEATYEDWKASGDALVPALFPGKWTISLLNGTPQTLVFEAVDVEKNPPPMPPESFRVLAPVGTWVEPMGNL